MTKMAIGFSLAKNLQFYQLLYLMLQRINPLNKAHHLCGTVHSIDAS